MLNHLRETTNLAEQGSYRCWKCREVHPLTEGIVVSWGGQVFFAQCPACFPGAPVIIRETILSDGRPGVHVGFANPDDAPRVAIPRSTMQSTFMAQAGLAKRQKREFPDE